MHPLFSLSGVAPSLADNQVNCTLPNPQPEEWENMTSHQQYMFEEHEKWRCFIKNKQLDGLAVGR